VLGEFINDRTVGGDQITSTILGDTENGQSLLKSTKPSLPFKGAPRRGRTDPCVIGDHQAPTSLWHRSEDSRINGLDAEGEGEFFKRKKLRF
jgi:hypothetical protein